jgi:asparagine N-glycosylation enzyme membrane subunit Stt3
MKKISFALVGVLFSTLVFANGTDEPAIAKASVAVSNSAGSSLFKVFYQAGLKSDVKISILDKSGNLIFTEKIKSTDGFLRPYNFENLKWGEYEIVIESNDGKKSQAVTYQGAKIEKYVNISKLAEDGKYLLTARSKEIDNINVNIFNQHNELVFSEGKKVDGEFAQVLNLKKLKAFTIEVTDSEGLLKSYRD